MHPVDIFAAGARDGVYPGAQLAASRECQRLVTASVGKLAPGAEATSDEVIYDLASLTKPLATTVLFGRALEEGRCELDDPLNQYVPGVHGSITLRHALEHSTGYPAHARFDQYMPSRIPKGSWDAWRHIVFEAVKLGREAPAGQRSLYSDIGFILLGAALEVMYAQPLSTAYAMLGPRLFYRDKRGPPALPSPWPRAPIAPTENCAPGDVHDENCRAMGGAAGHAGLWGNAEGVLMLAEQLVLAYHGFKGGLLKPETIRRIWQPSSVPGSTRTLGWDRPSKEGSSTGGRWPANSVGHLGFTGTSLWIEPERALIVVLLSNRVCPTRANNMIRRLRPLLHDAAWEAWGSHQRKKKEPGKKKGSKKKSPPARSQAGLRQVPSDEAKTQRIVVDDETTEPNVRTYK
jgi:CubicO group peptidase (beta-lactamase class C family)